MERTSVAAPRQSIWCERRRGVAAAPPPHVPRAPEPRGVGAVPNPRQPKLVRDLHGGALQDLFVVFPELPWPARPKRRIRLRT
jgi:hypothetical protein